MTITAFTVTHTETHPNADALRVYQLSAPGHKSVQVVANCDTFYQLDDTVAVALPGVELADGTTIRKARLRGVDSFGMIIGLAPDAQAGEDLSAAHGVSAAAKPRADSGVPEQARMIRWASIELLHNVVKRFELRAENLGESEVERPVVRYRAKVKLDGTNAGIQILPSGSVVAQSRSRILTTQDDNSGFGAWVAEHQKTFTPLAGTAGDRPVVLFGEWCGRGIQKRAAISQIDRKVFAVFAVQFGDNQSEASTLLVEPGEIHELLPEHPDVFVLPWFGEALELDFCDRELLGRAADILNGVVDKVETCDPWVREVFGIDGLGEGVVLYPELPAPVDRDTCADLMFKAKGEKHQVVKQRKPAQLDPEVAASLAQFVDLFVTEGRLQQGVDDACEGAFDLRKMGDFLRWIGNDVQKESADELAAAGLEWKQTAKAVSQAARDWYKAKATAL